MTGKPTTLGDLAHVFHGVGNADIFTAEKFEKANNPKEVEDCRVIKASDVTSQRPWQQLETTGVIHDATWPGAKLRPADRRPITYNARQAEGKPNGDA